MHAHVTANRADDQLGQLASPELERTFREFFDRWEGVVDPVAEDIERAIRQGEIDLGTVDAIRAGVEHSTGEFTRDVEVVFREHAEDAAGAGRALMARRHQLDVAFDAVPRRTISQLDDWSTTVSNDVAGTLEDEVTNYLKGAQEEGLSVDDVADQFQDEFVDGRIKDSKAEQLARDNTVAPSNAGSHSTYLDATGVVAEEWITEIDGRQRDSHESANGQIVGVDQPFVVGGHRADYPGDPSLPVEEFTNCRCTSVPVFADELTDEELATIRAGGRVWR